MTRLLKASLLVLTLYLVVLGARVYARAYDVWLPGLLFASLAGAPPEPAPVGPTHLFVFWTHHFEPGNVRARMDRWLRECPVFDRRHHDADGRSLRHSWFYPAEFTIDYNMIALRQLVLSGDGEVELHLHHYDPTYQAVLRRYTDAIDYMQRFGFLRTVDGQTRFAFIHGNSALDDSGRADMCGFRNELGLLRRLGCYADFDFPAIWTRSQPPVPDSIYEATDDDRAKSYARGTPVRVGMRERGDLLIFQGPLVVVPTWSPFKLFFTVEDGNIHATIPATPARVDQWVRANVHVQGRPEWVFVKLFGHPVNTDEDLDEALGPHMDEALRYLEQHYNDGRRYVLHYVTAREAYNLVRAAQAGKAGDPKQFYDFEVKPYELQPTRGEPVAAGQ